MRPGKHPRKVPAAAAAAAAGSRLEAQARAATTKRLASELRSNLEAYRTYAATARAKLAKERDALRKRQQDLHARRQRLAVAQQALSHRHAVMLGDKGISGALLHGLSMQLEDYEGRVAQERKKLVMQLLEFFPLDPSGHPGSETIANLPLPSDMRQLKATNEDARSAALAIVVHVLLIASNYLSLTLPFRMEFLGSKASIGRWGDGEPQTMLTGTGLALETGMSMLRRNVETLCFYQGIPSDLVKEWSFIHSLWQLFHSPSLGNPVRRSLLQADSRVGRVKAGQSLRRPVHFADEALTDSAHAARNARERHLVRAAEGSVQAARMAASTAFFQDGSSSIDFVSLDEVQDISTAAAAAAAEADALTGDAAAGENWDLIERPQPPKPSNNDDIQHWVSSGALNG
ncbi:Hypothetical Protein FCC1311_012452 [Hondaea fermentalgiana]|uniref:UV radiation resistance-associated gene protein n=1 Tax=Hondaea fermentalgiana TaxID=2315210 RepID=A0A2R5G5H0_9STRA|nr:Hypothetical Protein FCC1311_012452 [Hondaea fermentalgiana]|eukprot:GBG25028.1 Hypothetical Protein FCC1311_012452 [Hondaea fermentalgiana]